MISFRIYDTKTKQYITAPQLIPAESDGTYIVGSAELGTGVLDAAGHEIFENDILVSHHGDEVYAVIIEDCGFVLAMMNLKGKWEMTDEFNSIVSFHGEVPDYNIDGTTHEDMRVLQQKHHQNVITIDGKEYPVLEDPSGDQLIEVDGQTIDVTGSDENELADMLSRAGEGEDI